MAKRQVAALVRVSTHEQSVGAQREAIRRWADAQGLRVRYYAEEGVSGASRRRPVLDQVLADARAGKFETLVVFDLSRLARDVARLVLVLDELHAVGVRLVSVRESLDFGGPMGRAMAALLGAVAELERANIRERVRAGIVAARVRGQRFGKPRYVFKNDDLDRIHELRADGVSVRRMAREGLTPEDVLATFEM